MQLSLFAHSAFEFSKNSQVCAEELFDAYYQCRKLKRKSLSAMKFEIDFEENLFRLKEQLDNGTYLPGRSTAFIVNKPVKREIFAAEFRDRIVHHWLIYKLNPYFEDLFIEDSYACRLGKGTHFGINRINNYIKLCSREYSVDAYILKLDIQGFFMSINRRVLFMSLRKLISQYYQGEDQNLVLDIAQKVVFNNAAQNCRIRGNHSDWSGLPHNKSLFHSHSNCGLPIGNLTSQVFANFYLHSLDTFVTQTLGVSYYGRYVDDFVIVHRDKEFLKTIIPRISEFLENQLKLKLHPKKIYLQHYSKGVKFLGVLIKPNRIYISNRIKGNFFNAIQKQNRIIQKHRPDKGELASFMSVMNSYLGIMKHCNSYNLRKYLVFRKLSGYWLNHFYLSGGIRKFVRKVKPFKKKDMFPW
jgi:hypothetical protein